MNWTQWLQQSMTDAEIVAHIAILVVNIALFVFARPILHLVESGKDVDTKVRIFRSLNILVFILHLLDVLLLAANRDYQHYFIKLGLTLMTFYAGLFCFSLCSYLSRRKFGIEKDLDSKKVFLDSYNSRIVDIIFLVLIAFTTLYALIKIWGADSLLETTGIFGIVAAFLAFTSSIWAPDIISGLIILNTQMLEDGDVVVVDGYKDEYVINKVSFIYIMLFDIRNNHRTLIRNSRFIQSKIDNLSRIASTDGIRQALTYNIGYPTLEGSTREARIEAQQEFQEKVNRMFRSAFEAASEDNDIKINRNKEFEWSLTRTGDFALQYTLWIYLDRIPNTKVTATIRKHLMGTIYKVNEAVYCASIAEQLDLSTPNLTQIKLQPAAQEAIPHGVAI